MRLSMRANFAPYTMLEASVPVRGDLRRRVDLGFTVVAVTVAAATVATAWVTSPVGGGGGRWGRGVWSGALRPWRNSEAGGGRFPRRDLASATTIRATVSRYSCAAHTSPRKIARVKPISDATERCNARVTARGADIGGSFVRSSGGKILAGRSRRGRR